YSLPVRLARLADGPALAGLRLETVAGILSGGSALPPPAARKLAAHFGIPVTQGYGLAETSPLTHTERLDAPRTGSVGPVVAGTECRVVDLDTRRPVAEGVRGEVQVRGPQVMRAYLDPALPTGIDAEGWLSTGDIGYLDADGYLFLVDRIKDVFKCDNEIVSPTELERLLDRHPVVRESVVVDHPDPHRGAVAHAFVVLADPAGSVDTEAIRAAVNAEVPEYQHIRYLDVVPAIPRSPNGKVARRDIRAWVERPAPHPATRPTDTTGAPPMVTFINQLTVTGSAEEFEKISARMSEFMASRPGYLNHRLLRSLRAPESYVEIAEWENPEAHQAAVRSDEFQALISELGRVVAKPTPGLFTDVKPAH
ncbi:MAG TPA: AMP-binding protein, partial [Rugosimonospora sp.]|nr:AMP-binding protein [Rugosimonospora sp.]